jgi:hypothetical protein
MTLRVVVRERLARHRAEDVEVITANALNLVVS